MISVLDYFLFLWKMTKLMREKDLVEDVARARDPDQELREHYSQDQELERLRRKVQKLDNQVGHYKGELRELRGIQSSIET